MRLVLTEIQLECPFVWMVKSTFLATYAEPRRLSFIVLLMFIWSEIFLNPTISLLRAQCRNENMDLLKGIRTHSKMQIINFFECTQQ